MLCAFIIFIRFWLFYIYINIYSLLNIFGGTYILIKLNLNLIYLYFCLTYSIFCTSM